MEVIYTKDKEWLKKWDAYVVENPRASHLMLSEWLKSYSSYGFDYEVGIVIENNKIIGGFGSVIPKVLFFKFYIIPHGPIFSRNIKILFDEALISIGDRANLLNCCYVGVSLPLSNEQHISEYVYRNWEYINSDTKFLKGKRFNYIYTSYGLNWVNFNDRTDPESYLNSLSSKVRRNIRLPYRKNTRVSYVNTVEELKEGYSIIEENAKEAHYKVRSFEDIKETILSMIKHKQAYFITIYVDDVVKASAFFIVAGGYLTNIMGGVTRDKPDIKLGYMLQWEGIKKSFELGFLGYNISMGGSEGVKDFKRRFGAQAVFYDQPHYYKIIKPSIFRLYSILEKYIKPYKSAVSNLLSKFQ